MTSLEQLVRELIEHRNTTMEIFNDIEEDEGSYQAFYETQERAAEFEQMLVELGDIVGVKCQVSGGK